MAEIAAVVLINPKKEFLLYLRDDKPSIPYPNHWALLGGHKEGNETYTETLRREIREEIGQELNNPVFLGSFYEEVGNMCYIYKDSITKTLDELILTEGQKLGYFTFEEALNLNLTPALRKFFIEYKGKILKE